MTITDTPMKLVSPHVQFEQSFMAFIDHFVEDDPVHGEFYEDAYSHFPRYVESLINESQGVLAHRFQVPCHHFWMLSPEGEVVGAIRVRHDLSIPFLAFEGGHIGYDIAPKYRELGYGYQILSLGLIEAKKIGLSEILITADEDNVASRKIIEANGGKFERMIFGKVYPHPIARYWVTI